MILLVLSLFTKYFLYGAIIVLAMLNTSFHQCFSQLQTRQDIVVSGIVINESPYENYKKLNVVLDNAQLHQKRIALDILVDFYTRSEKILLGQRIFIKGRLKKATKYGRPNTLQGKIIRIEPNPLIKSGIIHVIRQYIEDTFENVFSAEHRDLAVSLVLGGSGRIPDKLKQSFCRAGVLHILAVSGLHVGFVVAFISLFLYFIPVPAKIKFGLLIIALLVYAAVTGFRPSVCRAVFMAFLFGLSMIVQRNVDPVHIINITAGLFLIFKPVLIFDIGAQMSFAAVYGIVIIYPVLEKRFVQKIKNKCAKIIAASIAVSFSAQVFVSPLLIYYFQRLPTMAVFSNFIIVPIASVSIFLLFTILIVGLFSLGLVKVIGIVITILFSAMTLISGWIADLSYSSISLYVSPVLLIFVYFLFVPAIRRTVIYVVIFLGLIFSLASYSKILMIRRTSDYMLVSAPSHQNFLFIEKCSAAKIRRFLERQHVLHIDYLAAPRVCYPAQIGYFQLPGVLSRYKISTRDLNIYISTCYEVDYKKTELQFDRGSTVDGIQYIMTNGDSVYRFFVPEYPMIIDQMIIDLKVVVLKIILMF